MIKEFIIQFKYDDHNDYEDSTLTEKEIIRCHDCKWRDELSMCMLRPDSKIQDIDFCSYGERKEVRPQDLDG